MSMKSFILRASTKCSKHMPTILVFGGVAVGITAAVIAVKKTPKLHEVITEDKKTLEHIKEMEDDPSAKFVVEQGETDDEPTLYAPYDHEVAEYDRKEVAKHMTATTIRTYALPVGLGLLSVTMILLGYKMKCKALIAMTASYNTAMATIKQYRKRVADKVGVEAENDIWLGKQTEVHESTDEDGNLTVEQVETINPVCESLVLRFDSSCSEHRNDAMFIRQFLNMVERTAQNTYAGRTVPHLYLTELTDALGMERDFAHSGKGWSDKLNPEEASMKINFTGNTVINEEDGEFVAYIPVDIDGFIV